MFLFVCDIDEYRGITEYMYSYGYLPIFQDMENNHVEFGIVYIGHDDMLIGYTDEQTHSNYVQWMFNNVRIYYASIVCISHEM